MSSIHSQAYSSYLTGEMSTHAYKELLRTDEAFKKWSALQEAISFTVFLLEQDLSLDELSNKLTHYGARFTTKSHNEFITFAGVKTVGCWGRKSLIETWLKIARSELNA